MKTGIIDVGSNSVRLALLADGKTLYKRLETTRLGEGISFSGEMKQEAIERTARAICAFKAQAEADGAESVFVFATAAVRSSSNKQDFLRRVRQLCSIEVEVIDGVKEAEIGLLGALKGKDGGIIDVGGASTEVTVQSAGKTVYAKSVNIGTVRLYDIAGRDRQKLEQAIADKLSEYGEFSAESFNMCAIGGTASRLASVVHNLTEYNPVISDGTVITVEEIEALAERLLTMPVDQIRATTICKKSAEIVGGGTLLMCRVMQKFGVNKITVSESDNIEGYYMQKTGLK